MCFVIPQTITKSGVNNFTSTNPAVLVQESHSRPVDHKSNAITTTLPSHLVAVITAVKALLVVIVFVY